ncbi:hypothetical protein [Nocardia sp. NPDC058480]|uniref:hypothetical protein n=1 Tax=unclassified Nocardia TaxID=2637762 RepID=UPI0036497860
MKIALPATSVSAPAAIICGDGGDGTVGDEFETIEVQVVQGGPQGADLVRDGGIEGAGAGTAGHQDDEVLEAGLCTQQWRRRSFACGIWGLSR